MSTHKFKTKTYTNVSMPSGKIKVYTTGVQKAVEQLTSTIATGPANAFTTTTPKKALGLGC